jgi:hypothetical protein
MLIIKICRTVILPTVVYGCETWSITLMEEQRLRVFENRVLRELVVGNSEEATADWKNCTLRSFASVLLTGCNWGDQTDGLGMWHEWGRR